MGEAWHYARDTPAIFIMIARFDVDNRMEVSPISSGKFGIEVEVTAGELLQSCNNSELEDAVLAHEDAVIEVIAPIIDRYKKPEEVFTEADLDIWAEQNGYTKEDN